MATPSDLKRTYIIKVRLNRSELDQFNVLAGDSPLAAYARRTLLTQQTPPGKKQIRKAKSQPPANSHLLRQIAYLGNNMNQIARSLNTQLKNHPDQAINTMIIAHILQVIWERLDDVQNIQPWDRPSIGH